MIPMTATTVKQALTPQKSGFLVPGFSHTLNPYLGCAFGEHGCPFCYVRASPAGRFGPAAWGTWVVQKANIAEVLEAELRRPRARQYRVFLASATDPYQAAEAHGHVTRQCLAVFRAYPVALGMATSLLGSACGSNPERVAPPGQGLQWHFGYDPAGRPTRIVDPAGRATTIHYALDDHQRVRRLVQTWPDATTVAIEFDALGRRLRMTDALGTVRYAWDGFGRLAAVHRDGAPALTYTWDTLDRLQSITVGDGLATAYSYDFVGRLAHMDTPAGRIAYAYQTGQGRIIRTLPNGIRTVWDLRPDGSLHAIAHVAADNRLLAQFTYAYRPDGLIRGIKEWAPAGERAVTYTYDTAQRLVAVADAQGTAITYRYDSMGNLLETSPPGGQAAASPADYDWAGRLVRHHDQAVTHDAAGKLTAYVGPQGSHTFAYTDAQLLQRASTPRGTVAYQYDGYGALVTRTAGTETTSFLPDPLADIWRPLLAEHSGGKRTLYVWEDRTPLAMVVDGEPHFYLHDHLGSVRAVTDRSGKVVQRFAYTPFGIPQSAALPGTLQPGFAGLFYDPISTVYLARLRAYDPALGRFLQREPDHAVLLSSLKDLSAYSYCGADPVNFVDVTGGRWIAPAPVPTPTPVPQPLPWPTPLPDPTRRPAPRSSAVGTAGSPPPPPPPPPQPFAPRRQDAYMLPNDRTSITPPQGKTPTERWGEVHPWRLFDATYAKQWYARQAEQALASAQGKGMGAGLEATAWDLIGGFIPGKPANQGQGYAQILWSLSPAAGTSEILRGLGVGRTFGSALIKAADGDHLGSALDIVALGGTRMGLQARALSERPVVTDSGQYVWSFADAKTVGQISHLETGSGLVTAFGIFRNAAKAERLAGEGNSPLHPTHVGGVYLRGAGEALKDLGRLTGIARDERTGRLILVSEDQGSMTLPPLRLDDVVTVFRCVYEHGEAPSVSIDPNPQEPQGPVMLVRHGPETATTHVGWILFEADRLLKVISLQRDNITHQPMKLTIAGYQSLLELGFSNMDGKQKEPTWERFWIVPASVERQRTRQQTLTLCTVPLKVNTQRMVWRGGKLEPAPGGPSSHEAATFSGWFTKHYQDIAAAPEGMSQPPCGGPPVPVFAELQRIAAITAIAENLRDQGVPMPAWMRDYPVTPCPVTPTTPAIVATASMTDTQRVVDGKAVRMVERTRTQRIYGGVNLAPLRMTLCVPRLRHPRQKPSHHSCCTPSLLPRSSLPSVYTTGPSGIRPWPCRAMTRVRSPQTAW